MPFGIIGHPESIQDRPYRYRISTSLQYRAFSEYHRHWDTGQRELIQCRWGFIPSWAKDAKMGFKNIRTGE
jgi:putative SOS response-associated peptidase YedK